MIKTTAYDEYVEKMKAEGYGTDSLPSNVIAGLLGHDESIEQYLQQDPLKQNTHD